MSGSPAAGAATYPDLAGKVAVVTGGSRGIGAATAEALAANGVAVAVVGRDRAAVDGVVGTIAGAGGLAIGETADCTREADLARLHARVSSELGSADILVAFAGGDGMPVATADESPIHWRRVVESDLTSTFLTISAFLPDLASRSGVILTMASAAARQAALSSAAYAAAKAGVVALSRHLARELAPDGIRVNCVAPSAIENDKMRTRMPEEARRQLGASFPLGRIGQPADVAAAALFLVSGASSWITGTTLDVAGGKVML
ncbi:MAG: SDR family NAD(P)-dependent oxidoreductase [Acidimicrobiales bacterium]